MVPGGVQRREVVAPHGVDASSSVVGVVEAGRGDDGADVVEPGEGLLGLAEKHPVAHLEAAAAKALHHGGFHLRDLKELLAQPPNVVQLDFLETHPLIRDLDAYGALLPACFENADTLDPQPPTADESNEP